MSEREIFSEIALENGTFETRVTRKFQGRKLYEKHDPRIIKADNVQGARGTLDMSRLDNRAIGIFEGAEVWVKPWMIQNYCFAWDAASPNKPTSWYVFAAIHAPCAASSRPR